MAQTHTDTNPDAPGRLDLLRAELKREGLDFFLVPSSDAHQSEYVPGAWQRRAWISGFNGSMGNVVVGLDGAWLWADSRYWLQAVRELDPGAFTLMRQGEHDVPSIARFLGDVGAQRKVGYDPSLHSPAEAKELAEAISSAGGTLVAVADNLVDRVWADRPALPLEPVEVWPSTYSGRAVSDKLAGLRKELATLGCDHLVITTLDEIAWTFDIRGHDVDFNPVTIAWAIVSRDPDAATLFISASKIGPDVTAHLTSAGVATAPYESFGEALSQLSGKVLVDKTAGNQAILDRLSQRKIRYKLARSPVMLARARKNDTEIRGMRAAHVRDGVALCRFLAWLDQGSWRGLGEVGAAARLEEFRKENELFRGLSFDTIAGYAGHGAIVHYRPTAESDQPLGDETLFLLDSGAQYLDGTTDVTRTIHLGTPSATEREHYTLVLRGHLALRHTAFPRGATGTHLDGFARAPLWHALLNYGHGTGHGVGCYLSVHQGPHRVSPALNDVALAPGMILSNEPGLYLEGRYGIRVENLLVVVEHDEDPADNPFGPFYAFDDLTMVPYCRKLIDVGQLSVAERAHVDAYHARVRATLLPHLAAHDDHDLVRAWLEQATQPLAAPGA